MTGETLVILIGFLCWTGLVAGIAGTLGHLRGLREGRRFIKRAYDQGYLRGLQIEREIGRAEDGEDWKR